MQDDMRGLFDNPTDTTDNRDDTAPPSQPRSDGEPRGVIPDPFN